MKKSLIILVLFLSASTGFAQLFRDRRDPSLSVGLQLTEPKGEFAHVYEGIPVGLGGHFTAPVANSPLELGVSFLWNSMNARNEDVSVLIGQDEMGNDIYDQGTLRIRNTMYRYQVIARIKPFAGRFQVYGDLFTGLSQFKTSTDIEIDNSGYSEVVGSRVYERDFAANYGWAIGLRIRLLRGIYVEGRFENVKGAKADYVDPNSIEVNTATNEITYAIKQSKTSNYMYQLGLAFQF